MAKEVITLVEKIIGEADRVHAILLADQSLLAHEMLDILNDLQWLLHNLTKYE